MLNQNQVEQWVNLYNESQSNQDWVEFHRERDESRVQIVKEMQHFLKCYQDGEIGLEEFRDVFHRNTISRWDGFGLKGLSGGMFLNKLVKHIPDQQGVEILLSDVLPVPTNTQQAQDNMSAFLGFLENIIDIGQATRLQLQPARTAFFLSAWWHIQDTELWPIFYASARHTLEAEKLFIPTQNPVQDYFSFREVFLDLSEVLGIGIWDLEHLCVWYENQQSISSPIDQLEVAGGDELAFISPSHTQIQWILAKIGKRLDCKVWIAANDHNKEWDGQRLGDLSLSDLPQLGLDNDSQRIIRLIDVVWLQGSRQVAAAFEVEHTTSIYSGLLRMSNLVALSPNLNFPLYIVTPKNRMDKVQRELSRPTFQALELHKRCGFFSDEDLLCESGNIMKWASDPSAIDKLAQRVGDIDT